jgi:membrane-associated PAP2 superfamily phosphatase
MGPERGVPEALNMSVPVTSIAERPRLGRADALITAAGLLLLLAWDASGLDLALIQAVGTSSGFAWRDAWWTSRVLHDGGRLLGWLVLAGLILNIWRPWWTGPGRRERVTWVLITLVCLLLVPTLKRVSATSCPWDLQVFGGVAAYVSHWQFGVADGGPGHCFPSGHAVAAFAFISGWFALRSHAPQAARWWLAGVLALGALFGAAQMVRGAHYASHTLWSAWICWTACAVLNALFNRPQSAPVPAASSR